MIELEIERKMDDCGAKLCIELVPQTCWGSNVRDILTQSDWNQVKKHTAFAAGHLCEICGGKGHKWPVECHEIWEYDDDSQVQSLMGTIALCPDCHLCKHWGYASVSGKVGRAENHIKKVNGWNDNQLKAHLNKVSLKWAERSHKKWMLDINWIKETFPTMEEKYIFLYTPEKRSEHFKNI